jgi:hypothetical protein
MHYFLYSEEYTNYILNNELKRENFHKKNNEIYQRQNKF